MTEAQPLTNPEGKLLTDDEPESGSLDQREKLGILQVLDQLERVSDALLDRCFIFLVL